MILTHFPLKLALTYQILRLVFPNFEQKYRVDFLFEVRISSYSNSALNSTFTRLVKTSSLFYRCHTCTCRRQHSPSTALLLTLRSVFGLIIQHSHRILRSTSCYVINLFPIRFHATNFIESRVCFQTLTSISTLLSQSPGITRPYS
jgi:hypothetical protein